jgi:hypothetical protein
VGQLLHVASSSWAKWPGVRGQMAMTKVAKLAKVGHFWSP